MSENLKTQGLTTENTAHLNKFLRETDENDEANVHDSVAILLFNALTKQKNYLEQENLARAELRREEKFWLESANLLPPKERLESVNRGLFLIMAVRSLNELNKKDEALSLIRERLATLEKLPQENVSYKITALTLLVTNLCRQKGLDDEIQYLSKALDLALAKKPDINSLSQINTAAIKSLVENIVNYNDETESAALKYLELVEKTPAELLAKDQALIYLSNALTTLGHVLYRRRKFDEADNVYQRLVNLEEKLENERPTFGKMKAYFVCGRNLRRLEKLAQAEAFLNAAVLIAPAIKALEQQSSYDWCFCNCYLLLAEIKLEQNKIDDAENLVQIASLQLPKLSKDSRLPLILNKIKGTIQRVRGELPAAESCLRKCIDECERWPIKNGMQLSDLYTEYSLILSLLGRTLESEKYEQMAQPDKQLHAKRND